MLLPGRIRSEESRADALSALAQKLPPELLPEALAAARAIQNKYYRAKALSALAQKLPPELLPPAPLLRGEGSKNPIFSLLLPRLLGEGGWEGEVCRTHVHLKSMKCLHCIHF
ncbi:MAG: hypothetical protein ACYTXF_11800 [Nostoc sp.]